MTDPTTSVGPAGLERPHGRPAPAGPGPAARARRGPRFGPTVMAAVATFVVLFEFLAFQLNSGNDPALGATVVATAQRSAKPAVLNRRIIKTRVVHDPPEPAATVTPAASSTVASTAVPTSSAPVPAAAPAPAPAPAAPVTSTS